ncbi:hypothetical protein ACFQ67_00095 [Streptomyces sp. NPDC056488]|uniref:hypothetical protein n=1 Tax=Streptomyces sp. NPDC056488 TaxID=3345836 RepID=UPI0036803452
MPAFPDFDPAGIAYRLRLWHNEWGPVDISVGLPSYPADVFAGNEGVEQAIREFAGALLGPIGGEKILGIDRVETGMSTWQPPEPEPSP